MSILNQPIDSTPSIQEVARNITINAQDTFQKNLMQFDFLTREIWQNPNATPAEIIEELGTNAGDVLKLHKELGDMLCSQVEGCIVCDSVLEYRINEDGTASLI